MITPEVDADIDPSDIPDDLPYVETNCAEDAQVAELARIQAELDESE
jgi:hypothetical protein